MNIITITINPAFDTHIYAENFKQGRENYAEQKNCQAGGKGVNVSRALSVNGIKNTALVLIGKENGKEFEKALVHDGVNFEAISTDGAVRENVMIHSSDETRISLEGNIPTSEEIKKIFGLCRDMAKEGDIAVFSGRIPRGTDKALIINELKKLSAGKIKLCIDTNSFSLDDIIEIKPFLIKPNKNELASICGEFADNAGALRAAEQAARRAGCIVLLSLGEDGAAVVSECEKRFARAPRIVALSTVGAGDSMLAGFISSLTRGKSMSEALVCAVAWGSAKCLRYGTLPPLPEDIANIVKNVACEEISEDKTVIF